MTTCAQRLQQRLREKRECFFHQLLPCLFLAVLPPHVARWLARAHACVCVAENAEMKKQREREAALGLEREKKPGAESTLRLTPS